MRDPIARAEYEVSTSHFASAKTQAEKVEAGKALAAAVAAKAMADAGATHALKDSSGGIGGGGSSNIAASSADSLSAGGTWSETIDINHYPQAARYRTNKDTQFKIIEMSQGAAIIGKGVYVHQVLARLLVNNHCT